MTVEPDVFVGLGSNLGDRAANLSAARASLSSLAGQITVSSIYETEPWGVPGLQPAYLNQVVRLATDLPPDALAAQLRAIEAALGRERVPGEKWAPRVIDLDLLLYGRQSLDTLDLTVPHAHLAERAFVLVPLAELAPDLVHPILRVTIAELLGRADVSGVRRWAAAQKQGCTAEGIAECDRHGPA